MKNTISNSANSASQPTLPFSRAAIDWTQPVQLKFSQLQIVRHAAERAGFFIARLKVVTGGYEIQYQPKAK
jgi:hypothetical protein